MNRALVWILSGVLTGAVISLVLHWAQAISFPKPAPVVPPDPVFSDSPTLPIFARRWVSNEPDQLDLVRALDQAQSLSDPYARREAALAIVGLIGLESADLDQVFAIIPEADRIAFRIEALANLAATDPSGAIEKALLLNGSAARRRAIEAIAAKSVTSDPVTALALLDQISDQTLNLAFRHSAILKLAEIDPAAAIEQLRSADASLFGTFGERPILERVADREPELLLSVVNEFPQSVRGDVRNLALRATGEQDPEGALRILATLTDANERGSLLVGIATNYARVDPSTALERVLAIDPASRMAAGAVLSEIAQIDLDRAIEIALQRPSINNYTSTLALPISALGDRARGIADSLVLAGVGHESALGVLTRNWAMEDPGEALEWALANRGALQDTDIRWISTYTARRNAADAAAEFDRLPQEVGDIWVEGFMPDFVDQDPAAAARFALNLPEGSVRDQAIGTLISTPLGYGDTLDVTVLDGASSPAVRDELILGTDPYLRPANLLELEKLVPYISEPVLRARFEQRLEFIR